MKTVLIALILLITLSGCVTYKAVTQSAIMGEVLKVSVGRVLEGNSHWVEPTYRFTQIAMDTLKGQSIVDFGVIDDVFLQVVEDYLIPEEQDLALNIFTAIKEEVYRDLTRRGITEPASQKVYIMQVLTWVNTVAISRL